MNDVVDSGGVVDTNPAPDVPVSDGTSVVETSLPDLPDIDHDVISKHFDVPEKYLDEGKITWNTFRKIEEARAAGERKISENTTLTPDSIRKVMLERQYISEGEDLNPEFAEFFLGNNISEDVMNGFMAIMDAEISRRLPNEEQMKEIHKQERETLQQQWGEEYKEREQTIQQWIKNHPDRDFVNKLINMAPKDWAGGAELLYHMATAGKEDFSGIKGPAVDKESPRP